MHEDVTRLGLLDDQDIALDEAALALALLDHPNADLAPHRDVVAAIVSRLESSGDAGKSQARAEALAQIVGEEFDFTGDVDTYDDPANADLIQVIERRRGLPVSLSILYVSAARRIGWTANILDVPGHVLVLVGHDEAPVMIDPFRRGAAVGGEQLAGMLAAIVPETDAAVRHVAAMPNRAILVRLLLNQATRAEQAGHGRRALQLYERMTALAPEYGQVWWERARLELIYGDVGGARNSLMAMLEITRDAAMRQRILQMLERLGAV